MKRNSGIGFPLSEWFALRASVDQVEGGRRGRKGSFLGGEKRVATDYFFCPHIFTAQRHYQPFTAAQGDEEDGQEDEQPPLLGSLRVKVELQELSILPPKEYRSVFDPMPPYGLLCRWRSAAWIGCSPLFPLASPLRNLLLDALDAPDFEATVVGALDAVTKNKERLAADLVQFYEDEGAPHAQAAALLPILAHLVQVAQLFFVASLWPLCRLFSASSLPLQHLFNTFHPPPSTAHPTPCPPFCLLSHKACAQSFSRRSLPGTLPPRPIRPRSFAATRWQPRASTTTCALSARRYAANDQVHPPARGDGSV